VSDEGKDTRTFISENLFQTQKREPWSR